MNKEPGYNQVNKYCRFDRKTEALVGNEDYKKNFEFEEAEEMMGELNNFTGVPADLVKNMQKELNQAMTTPESVLIVGTEGTKTITIITAPRDVVGENGPVLIPTMDKNRVVAMVSAEYVYEAAEYCREVEENQDYSENGDGAQDLWSELLEGFFEKTVELAAAGGEAILEIPDFIPEEGF